MEAYSMDLRKRVIQDCDAGLGTQAVAQKYRVSTSWIRKVKQIRRETGQIGPRQQRVSHATKLDGQLAQLQEMVAEQPDLTLRELRDKLGVTVSLDTISRALHRLKLTFKKKSCMPPSSSDRTYASGGCVGKPR